MFVVRAGAKCDFGTLTNRSTEHQLSPGLLPGTQRHKIKAANLLGSVGIAFWKATQPTRGSTTHAEANLDKSGLPQPVLVAPSRSGHQRVAERIPIGLETAAINIDVNRIGERHRMHLPY